ncbi:sterol desaturase family protein [Tsukamurella serpentis]
MASYVTPPIAVAIPFFVVFIFVEYVALRVIARAESGAPKRRGYQASDAATSISMGVGYLIVAGVFHTVSLVGYSAIYQTVPWKLSSSDWKTWILLFIAIDLLWYAVHRFSHRIRIAWAAHQAHHSSENFNLTTALRQKWNLWFETLAWTPLPFMGIPPWMIYIGFSINLVCQFWVHTESIDRVWRPIEYVFNTPSHHRVHHGSDPEYLDKNYGGILIIWDRIFGTYAEEKQRPTYGLTKPVNTHNLIRLQFHEYASIARDVKHARGWREKIGYTFGPPGWQPPSRTTPAREQSHNKILHP